MPIFNSYVRSIVVNLLIFVMFVAWLWHKKTEPGFLGFLGVFIIPSIPALIVTLLVSTFLRTRDEPRSWMAFGLASLVGWFVLLFLAIHFLPSL